VLLISNPAGLILNIASLSLDSEDEWSASVLLHTSSAKEAM
jgi:hypothetical protein